MAVSLPFPRAGFARIPSGPAFSLFGPACAAALLAGVALCLLLPALPPRGLLAVLLAGSLLLLGIAAMRQPHRAHALALAQLALPAPAPVEARHLDPVERGMGQRQQIAGLQHQHLRQRQR